MFSVEDINEMQKTIERKDRIIKVLKERVRQWVKEYNILDEIIEMYKMSENEANEIIAILKAYKDVNEDFKTAWEELKADNERLKNMFEQISKEHCGINEAYITNTDCLQEIKGIAETYLTDCQGFKCDAMEEILQKITKAEEE